MKTSLLALTLLVLFVIFMLISCGWTKAQLTREQVEEKITKDLPVGSDYSNVQHYLENHKIEYSWVEDEKTFYAIIRNTNSDFLVRESVQIIIHMDIAKKISQFRLNPFSPGHKWTINGTPIMKRVGQ